MAGSVSNAGALLKWQPVEGADIYKVYRKLASEPDSAYKLTTTATVPTANLAGLAEGTAYNVRVAAMNGKGLSEPSDTLNVTTKQAKYKFDFGPVGARSRPATPRSTGPWRTPRSAASGSRTSRSSATGTAARSPATCCATSCLSGSSFEFQLDVPNGTYALKTYHSDWIGSTRTDVAAEGTPFGQVSSSRASSAPRSSTRSWSRTASST